MAKDKEKKKATKSHKKKDLASNKTEKKALSFFNNKKQLLKTCKITGFVLIGLVVLIRLYNLNSYNRIYPRTYAGSIDLGGKSLKEATNILSQAISAQKNSEIKLKFEDKNWTLKLNELNLDASPEKIAHSALNIGRKGGFKNIVRSQWKSVLKGNQVIISSNYNQDKLNEFLVNVSKEIDKPEKNATIVVKDSKATVEKEVTGERINLELVKKQIFEAVSSFSLTSEIVLYREVVQPKVKFIEAEVLLEQINNIIKEKIVLKSPKKNFNLETNEFGGWLDYKLNSEKTITGQEKNTLVITLKDDAVSAYVTWLSLQIDQKANDAKFNIQDGKASAFQQSQIGYKLDQEKTKTLIQDAILKIENKVTLPVEVIEPLVSATSAEKMGIKEVIGEGISHFYGSPTNRRKNIAVGAKALHGLIIKPGEEFSTDKALTPIDGTNGYFPGLVIKDGRTVTDFGGGICQVSTTLFRAVLNAGLDVTERSAHAYRVGYYEPPVGMDATIYDPTTDFKFINNTDYPILIQTYVKDGDSEIGFIFYGTKDSRNIEISRPVVYNITPPGAPIYVESSKLETGDITQVESAHNGATASFTYKVTKGSEVLSDDTFKSSYTPWTAMYLYGPGTEIPPAQ